VEAAAVPQPAPALRLGELLVRAGAATQEHVDQALELQPVLRKKIGELRLALGLGCTLAVAAADALEATIRRTYRLTIAVTDRAPDVEEIDAESMADGALDLVNELIGRAVNAGAAS